jgi:DNA-binding IclR family transcriptional regulator
MAVLEALARSPGSRHTDLATQTGIARATLHRILTTLESAGYLHRHETTDRYSLTDRFTGLCSRAAVEEPLVAAATRVATALAAETEETVHVAAMRSDYLEYVVKRESTRPLRVAMTSRAGGRVPFHATALGKAVLSRCTIEERTRLLNAHPREQFTAATITEISSLMAELDASAERGYAVDNEEHEIGIRCIAAAVTLSDSGTGLLGGGTGLLGGATIPPGGATIPPGGISTPSGVQHGVPVAAISVSLPTVRCPVDAIPEWGARLQRAAAEIEAMLGRSAGRS